MAIEKQMYSEWSAFYADIVNGMDTTAKRVSIVRFRQDDGSVQAALLGQLVREDEWIEYLPEPKLTRDARGVLRFGGVPLTVPR